MRTHSSGLTYLFGATSLVGWNILQQADDGLIPFCNSHTKTAMPARCRRLNIDDESAIRTLIKDHPPQAIIYCAGVCDVEQCQKSPEWTSKINVASVESIVKLLPSDTRFVYCSSDHVFGGDGIYSERSVASPVSIYGEQRVLAEQAVLDGHENSIVIRFGLPIGASADGKSGHLDWLKYRTAKALPITIVDGEVRSAVWADALAGRILEITNSTLTGVRHIPATKAVTRIELARYLIDHLKLRTTFCTELAKDRPTPHIGHVALRSEFEDRYAVPLPAVTESCDDCSLLSLPYIIA